MPKKLVPFRSNPNIWKIVEQVRQEIPASRRDVPIDIFDVIDLDMNLDLIPHRGLQDDLGAGASLSIDTNSIYIDGDAFDSDRDASFRRARFSASVELGHYVLHKNILSKFQILTEKDWRAYASTIFDPQEYEWLVYQANEFAGRLLVPHDDLLQAVINDCHAEISDSRFKALPVQLKAKGLSTKRKVCDHFQVNRDVIEIRLLREDILQNI